ncbi:hypothetical protein M422DRAFT_44462 [Sphaerobolus stellatus SS14]|nr:hypothetical protein M422DRAFT_44462 [Sphaerobolus stellatus SS14]
MVPNEMTTEAKSESEPRGTSGEREAESCRSFTSLPDGVIYHILEGAMPPTLQKDDAIIYHYLDLYPWKRTHPYWARRQLLGINRRCRNIVMSRPKFWSSLIIDPLVQNNYEDMKMTLRNSGKQLLTAVIRPCFSPRKLSCTKAVKLLRRHLTRIENLHICFMYKEEYNMLFPSAMENSVVAALPCLTYLHIPAQTIGPALVNDEFLPISLLLGRIYAPNLKEVSVKRANILNSLSSSSFLPIRRLIVDHGPEIMVSETLVQFLSICPFLETLQVSARYLIDFDNPWPDSSRITLNGLRTFTLDTTPGNEVLYFLRTLHTPCLKFFRFRRMPGTQEESIFTLQIFWWFMTETQGTLKELILDDNCMPPHVGVVEPLLKNMTNLQILEFCCVELRDSVFEALTPTPDLLPGESIIHFIESRGCIHLPTKIPDPLLTATVACSLKKRFDFKEEWIVEHPGQLQLDESDWKEGRRCVMGIWHSVFFMDKTLAGLLELKEKIWGLRIVL